MPSTLQPPPPPATPQPRLPDRSIRRQAEGAADETNGAPPAIAASMLPAELLQPGEIIILLLKPSPWYILLGPIKMLVGVALVTALLIVARAAVPIGLGRNELIALGTAAGGLRLFWQFLDWLSRVYVLTDQRVIRVMGVLRISVFETPLQQVQHTQVLVSIRERLFGLGTIGFATAGTGGYEAFWLMISKPFEVHQKVVQTLRRYRR